MRISGPKLMLFGLGSVAAAVFAAGNAHADTTIGIPGHTDTECGFYTSELERTNQVPENFQCVHYSASIEPGFANGTATMDQSTDEAADNAQAILNNVAPWEPVTCRAYSEGTAGCLKLAQRVGPRIHVVLDGDPYGSTGMFKNPLIDNPFVEPILNVSGIPTDLPVPPGTERNFRNTDLWANGGRQDPGGLLQQVIHLDGHSVQDPAEPNITWQGPDGEINHEWGDGEVPGVVDGPPPVVDVALPDASE